MASDLLLFYTQEFAYIALADGRHDRLVDHAAEAQPGRARAAARVIAATTQACLDETLMITAKLPSGYQRDLQRLKAPVFRGIDLAIDSVDIMAFVLDGWHFVPANIGSTTGIFATEEAYRIVATKACRSAMRTARLRSAILSADRLATDRVDPHETSSVVADDARAAVFCCRLRTKRPALHSRRSEPHDGAAGESRQEQPRRPTKRTTTAPPADDIMTDLVLIDGSSYLYRAFPRTARR